MALTFRATESLVVNISFETRSHPQNPKPQSINPKLPIVSIVVPFLVNQKLYYRILTIKLVDQKKDYNGDYR